MMSTIKCTPRASIVPLAFPTGTSVQDRMRRNDTTRRWDLNTDSLLFAWVSGNMSKFTDGCCVRRKDEPILTARDDGFVWGVGECYDSLAGDEGDISTMQGELCQSWIIPRAA